MDITITLDSDQTSAVTQDREANLFHALTNEEYLALRLMEQIVEPLTQRLVYEPEERAAIDALKQAREDRKKPKP